MGICISHSLVSPRCPSLRPIQQQLTCWADPGSTPNKGNPFLQACVCSTAPAHSPALHVGWEAARVAYRAETSGCILRRLLLPSSCRSAGRAMARTACSRGGKPTSSPSPRLQAGLGSGSGWVGGRPAPAAVLRVGEEMDGGTAGSRPGMPSHALAWQHGPNHDPAPATCPRVGAERAARFCAACGGRPALLRQMRGSRFSSRVI